MLRSCQKVPEGSLTGRMNASIARLAKVLAILSSLS